MKGKWKANKKQLRIVQELVKDYKQIAEELWLKG